MDLWTWITDTTRPSDIIATSGMIVIALLFARDQILTKGQHLRAIQDLKDHFAARIKDLQDFQERERTAQNRSYSQMEEARNLEKSRADSLSEKLMDALEIGRAGVQALQAIDKVAKEGGSNEHRAS